jgi:hypothetical protein
MMQEEKKVNSKGEQNSDSGSKSIVGNRRRRKRGGCGCGKKKKQA